MTDNQQPLQTDPGFQGGELSFADIVAFFQRHWRLIFGTAFAAGLLTGLVVILFVPRSYEAAATLIIVPPKFASDLKPSTLTVQGYQQLLESDAVIAEARRRLVAKGQIDPDKVRDTFRIGKALGTRIFASRRAEETVLAPMLQAVARGRSPEQAAEIANEWASVFLERTRQLMAGPTSATVELIDKQYPEARSAVEKLEQQRNEAQTGLQQRFDDTVTKWDDTITSYKNQTADLVATFRAETKRILESFSATKNLETRKVRLDAMRKAYADLQDEQTRVNSQLEQRKLELEAVRKQLAAAPQYLDVRKAITDDALWQTLAGAKDKNVNWSELQGRSLVSQQLNPMFEELSTRSSKVETDVFTLMPRAEQLKGEIARLSAELQRLNEEYGADASGLEKLKQERDAGLERLQEDRANGLGQLTRNKQRALDDISREREARLAQLNRDISHEQELYAELAKAFNQAVLAKAQENVEDVRLGAPAVPPETPKPRGGAIKALLAAILGGMLGVFIALVREAAAKPA
jgi:uncharacterized protein involved in exopolysaccharide biosynthesis